MNLLGKIARLDRKITWLRGQLAVLLVLNVAFAFWNFHRGSFFIAGVSTGAALLCLVAVMR